MSAGLVATLHAPAVRAQLERHRAFWRRGPAERPLRGPAFSRPAGLPPREERYELSPELAWQGFHHGIDRLEAAYAREGVLQGDLFCCAGLPGEPPWMPAILGCRIWVLPASHGHWWEPLPGGWEQLAAVDAHTGQAWRQVLREGMRLLVQRLGADYPIATFHGRGAVDMLAGTLGEAAMCLRIADDPEGVRRVLTTLTRLWIEVAQEVNALVPAFAGGHFHRYGLWAPGSLAAFSTDAAGLISPQQYRELFLPFDRQMAAAFEHVLLHTHSASAQHGDAWLTLPHAAIQLVDDPKAPLAWPDLLALCRRIQESGHPLMLQAQPQHYAAALKQLSPAGLALRGGEKEQAGG